ncbi:DUF5053 domain-containing protein [Odoribacter sp. OttesenSCG-928-J03]|nr:DUF5053 domain-containing protein [Odoribacter sp. OttesenSCG-928-J03]
MKNVIEKELAMLQACKSLEEREALVKHLQKQHENDTPQTLTENLHDLHEKVDELSIELKLLMISKFGISLTYVAEHFLGKSRSYLSQRLHNNKVNGKVAKLTSTEIEAIQNGLRNMCNELRGLADSLV